MRLREGACFVLTLQVLYSQLWALLGRPTGKQTPSTGLLAIVLALGVCDSVSLFGFSRAGGSTHCAHHYWNCPKWTRNYTYLDPKHRYHDWLGEVALREQWLKMGVVLDGERGAGFHPTE